MDRNRIISLAVASLLPFVSSFFYFVIFSDNSAAPAIYSATKLFTLIWPLIAFRFFIREKTPRIPLTCAGVGVKWGIASGFVISAGLLAAYFGIFRNTVDAAVPSMQAKVTSMGIGDYYVQFALFLAVAHSLLEEYYWRWFVFGQMKRVTSGGFKPHALAGLAFSLHHVVIATQFFPFPIGLLFGLCVGVGGIVWSLLYQKFDSLLPGWISHMIVDLTILSVGYQLLMH